MKVKKWVVILSIIAISLPQIISTAFALEVEIVYNKMFDENGAEVPSTIELYVGEEYKIDQFEEGFNVIDSDGNIVYETAHVSTIWSDWNSSNSHVALCKDNGQIIAISPGIADISISSTNTIQDPRTGEMATVECLYCVTVIVKNPEGNADYNNDPSHNEPSGSENDEYTLPPIYIVEANNTDILNQKLSMTLNEKKTFTLGLLKNIWQESSIAIGNKTIPAYVSRDSYGNLFYLQVDTISWQVSGDTGSVSKTSGTGGSFTLTGKQSGTVTLTATVPCGYLVQDGDRWVDQGMVGLASASATIQVAQGAQYHNPFANASEDVEVPFADLDPKAWYAPFVKALAAAGFYVGCDFSTSFDGSAVLGAAGTGTSGGVGSGGSTGSGSSGSAGTTTKKINFNASTAENRANTVVVFYNGHKAIGGNVGSYTKNPFWDVSSSHSYYQPVLWGSAQTIVKGYGQGTFGPANGITREQFCTILLRYADYAGIPLSASKSAKTFTDGGSISSWAKDAVVACQMAGIINGYPDGSFRPQNGITRAEVSKMIYMFFNAIS